MRVFWNSSQTVVLSAAYMHANTSHFFTFYYVLYGDATTRNPQECVFTYGFKITFLVNLHQTQLLSAQKIVCEVLSPPPHPLREDSGSHYRWKSQEILCISQPKEFASTSLCPRAYKLFWQKNFWVQDLSSLAEILGFDRELKDVIALMLRVLFFD